MHNFCSACLAFFLITIIYKNTDAQEPIWWITDEEAVLLDKTKNRLKPDKNSNVSYSEVNREEDAGPFIYVEAPNEDKLYKQLIDILIRFEKNPLGEPVNMDSLKVIYLKFFDIDITNRVLPYVKENQIDATKIKLPKGEHRIKIFIKDYDERQSSRVIKVTVKG